MERPKSRPNHRLKFDPKRFMDFRLKVKEIVNTVSCAKHNKPLGKPCWWIHGDAGVLHMGICGHRAGKLYNGKIDPKSIRNHTSKNKKERSR